eukprot:gnl/TRDRNA2_/TRDRNA2_174827_c0_seq1.p1 gnl/TRDRNA2_/TRDRNA2_174827_c0~~gnl/TRDRNA2_/TRDRNA2_174827_c0_seq1.p1  ORF type:complete len:868 (-),score=202.70 gnl/TRDRNA2_/TRDRNA2_174827_c0_seq1:99-2702(-)
MAIERLNSEAIEQQATDEEESEGEDDDEFSESEEEESEDESEEELGRRAVTTQGLSVKMWTRPRGEVAASLKERFRDVDTNRDGMLDISELSRFLPNLSPEEMEKLFACVDRDDSGKVSFNEFVDFLFHGEDDDSDDEPASKEDRVIRKRVQQLEESILSPTSFSYLDSVAEQENVLEKVEGIQIVGSTLGALNGAYEIPGNDWIVDASVAVNASGSSSKSVNGFPKYERTVAKPGCKSPGKAGKSPHRKSARRVLFYGWTKGGEQKQGRKGWFIAEEAPLEGEPVEKYISFNPSPLAETPVDCCATWLLGDGAIDRKMFCEKAEPEWDGRGKATKCIEEELWEQEASFAQDTFDEAAAAHARAQGLSGLGGTDGDGDDDDAATKAASDAEEESKEDHDRRQKSLEAAAQQAAEAAAAAAERARRAAAHAARRKKKEDEKEREVEWVSQKVAPGFKVVKVKDHLALMQRSESNEMQKKMKVQADAAAEAEDANSKGKKKKKQKKSKDTKLKEFVIERDAHFFDEGFAPSRTSLGGLYPEVDGWTRLSKLHENPRLFLRIVPDDVLGGDEPGNMWFLSACAAVAEYPGWTQSMFFEATEMAADCKYKVRLFHPGKRKFVRVTIDDYVPTIGGTAPAFTGLTSDGEIWVALVEKAFAKLCRSYAHMEWGHISYGLFYLCGGAGAESWTRLGPSRWRLSRTVWNGKALSQFVDRTAAEGFHSDGDWCDEDQLWSMLRRCMELCYPVACSVDRRKSKESGLLDDRSYSLIGTRNIPASGDMILRMVLLRNPFGIGEWKGRWSDRSEAWIENSVVAKILDFSQKRDGVFWMSFSDFLVHFEAIDLVRKSMPVQGCHKAKFTGMKRGLGLAIS